MKMNKSNLTVLALAGLVTVATGQDPSEPAAKPAPSEPAAKPAPAEAVPDAKPDADEGLRINFRGAPLEMVLDYMSDAAGFIIVLETEVEGTVNVWSQQPLNKQEAVDLLDTVLNQNGFAAIRQGRTLRIVKRDDAAKQNIPVKTGSNPEQIPENDVMITQIIPIRYADATQILENLQPLLPEYASLTANESGNALVLTDTQASVHRMTEIVRALDTAISGISALRVFPLRYADATTLAEAVTKLFEPPQSGEGRSRGRGNPFFGRGGDREERGSSRGSGNSLAQQTASRVVAVADERSNSLIVGASEEHMPSIEDLVRDLDVQVDDTTDLRVFPLKNADPVELAQVFADLFPDGSEEDENGRRRFRFGPPGFFGRGDDRRDRDNNPTQSERQKNQGSVIAVADPRTSSLIVKASTSMMPQIERMVEQLDSSSKKKQRVYVYSLDNADVREVEGILRGMFERSNTQVNRNTVNDESALSNRRQNNLNQNNTPTGFGSGIGTGGGLGTGGNRNFR